MKHGRVHCRLPLPFAAIPPALIGVDANQPATVRDELAKRGRTLKCDATGRPVRFTGGTDARGEGMALGN